MVGRLCTQDELVSSPIEHERAEEARLPAERLDPDKLGAASPGTHWDVRVEALNALVQISYWQARAGQHAAGIRER